MKFKRAESRCRYLTRSIAAQKGWNVGHPGRGGNFLEEQEIENFFPDCGLNGEKPDFLVCLKGLPVIVVEAKNDARKIGEAISEAIEYAEEINRVGKYSIRIAVGVAGEEDHGYLFETRFLDEKASVWVPLTSKGYALTSFPTVSEVEAAFITDNGTTEVSIPCISDYIQVAIELSTILRSAKIEPSLRPKVLGAVITALYWGEIELGTGRELESINSLVRAAISATENFDESKKAQLIETLCLTRADFNRLSNKIGRIVYILKRLNIRSVLQTDTDLLGLLYEAFIRYGYDNNSLGIVFTPRHITRFCAELIDVGATDKVIDVACGSGGFLVAAFDRMVASAKKIGIPVSTIKESLYGYDTNPTVWALATLNMFFRGDGKSHIENENCFDKGNDIKRQFTKALLNPPFSQAEEPERDFIATAMEALQPMGKMAVVVKSGIFADDDNAGWRQDFVQKHTVLGSISLPGDLFYPTAVDTTILIAEAHRPQKKTDRVFLAKIWNDGYRKLKGKRVDCDGSQLPEVLNAFREFLAGRTAESDLVTWIDGEKIMERGAEFSPEQYLPQPRISDDEQKNYIADVMRSILTTAVSVSDIVDEVLPNFPSWNGLPEMEYGREKQLDELFDIVTGKSMGESNYLGGSCPYISSGDPQNSVIRLVIDYDEEVFEEGGITVTCFGHACVQPWRFMARGNGGSAVRILIPKYSMTFAELAYFAAQINIQRWRFFYGRMAILKRLKKIIVKTPPHRSNDEKTIAEKLHELNEKMIDLMEG